jgi:sugar/nucleoside kinase (ribokinase family)
MHDARFDVLGIGNAIVDVMARTEDDFIVARAETLYDAMGPAIEASGGSAGNTAVGVASLGGRAAFIGKVADDALGAFYRHDAKAAGVHFETAPLTAGAPTARSFILITPDGERTMNTYLGACQALSPADIDEAVVADAAITYLEGYLWDPPEAKRAFLAAAKAAHRSGRKVSLTLSDPFCVDRYRGEFLDLMRSGTVDILLANASELHSLYQTADFDTAIAALKAECQLAAVTTGADGAVVVSAAGIVRVPATPAERLVDLTGAGDLFASGFLLGVARGMNLANAARLGTIAAAEVISHIGPRPAVSLRGLAQQAGYGI